MPNPAALKAGIRKGMVRVGKIKNNGKAFLKARGVMKKMMMMLVVVLAICSLDTKAVGIKVSISPKAYWDGTGCKPRPKGGCVHVEAEINLLAFELSNNGGKLELKADRSILNDPLYGHMFQSNTFYVGEITIDQNILKQLNFNPKTVFADKEYKYRISGGQIIITL